MEPVSIVEKLIKDTHPQDLKQDQSAPIVLNKDDESIVQENESSDKMNTSTFEE